MKEPFFFVLHLLFFDVLLCCPLCLVCFTSHVTLTGIYNGDEPNFAECQCNF